MTQPETGRALEMIKSLTSGTRSSVAVLSEGVRCRGSKIQRLRIEHTGDDLKWAAPWLRRRRGRRCAHLGAREDARVMQIDGGGSGKLAGRTALAGDAPIDGGEQLLLRGRDPTPARLLRRSWARTRGEKGPVSAGFMGKRVQAREKRRGGQHGSAVVVVYLGHGELEGGHGRLRLRGYGSALLAVHERGWWSKGEAGVWRGGNGRARGCL